MHSEASKNTADVPKALALDISAACLAMMAISKNLGFWNRGLGAFQLQSIPSEAAPTPVSRASSCVDWLRVAAAKRRNSW